MLKHLFKHLSNLYKLLKLVSKIELQDTQDGLQATLGRLTCVVTEEGLKVKFEGVVRFDSDYLLLLCDEELDPTQQPTFLETYKTYASNQLQCRSLRENTGSSDDTEIEYAGVC